MNNYYIKRDMFLRDLENGSLNGTLVDYTPDVLTSTRVRELFCSSKGRSLKFSNVNFSGTFILPLQDILITMSY
jgi:hypothetical protein